MIDPQKMLRLRLVFDENGMLGPGKADLLEKIEKTGSISAAGRQMGMSYKRAWMLVETMNAIFQEPVVRSSRGGATGGGAELTEMGKTVLRIYRALHKTAWDAAQSEITALQSLCRHRSDG